MSPPDNHDARREDRQFAVFAMLMAVGVMFHQSILSDWQPLSPHMLVSLTAIWVLFRPASLPAFLVMVLSHLVSFVIDLPYVVNHWMFTGVLDLAVLLCLAGAMLRQGSWRISGGDLYRELAPTLRWSVAIMYLFAALAKLNWDFFNLELSAATSLYDELAAKVRILPRTAWTHTLAIYGTAILECSLPILLLWRPTRVLGILLAIAFHFAMGVAGFIPFSGFALAYLFLFLPEDMADRCLRWLAASPWRARWAASCGRLLSDWRVAIGAALLWLLIAVVRSEAWLPPAEVRLTVIRIGQALFLVYYVGFTLLMLRLLQPRFAESASTGETTSSETDTPPGRDWRASLRLTNPLYAAIPLLLIFNGLCPYLGLKTESSFAMYSNLQTEGTQWNHLFMPQTLRVFGMQNDLVRIVDSDHPPFQRAAAEGIRLTWFEFHRESSHTPGIAVTYQYQGREVQVADTATDPVLSKPPRLLWQKCLWFREVPLPEKNTIRH